MVVSQNGKSCSRGLPASCVMITLSRSTWRIRSRITRYWLIGTSSESRCFAHSASHACLIPAISSVSAARAVLRLRRPHAVELRDQRIDDKLRITYERKIGLRILVDVGRVVGGMDDRLAFGQRGPERGLGQARTDRKDQIGPRHELREHLGLRARGGAERQRMRFGDRALARDWCRRRVRGSARRAQRASRPHRHSARPAPPRSAAAWPRGSASPRV